MEAAGDHPVPSGPLAVRWLACDPGRPRAGALGTARLAFENAGTVPWPPTGERRVCLGYHWLDELGNPIVWDGLWTALPREVAPGERVEADLTVRGPLPPGPYRLAFDLVAADRAPRARRPRRRPGPAGRAAHARGRGRCDRLPRAGRHRRARLGAPDPRRARGGLRRRRRLRRRRGRPPAPPAARARAVRARRWPQPRLRAPAPLSVSGPRGRSNLGRPGRGAPRVEPPAGRAVALRRTHTGHSSTAIWSSTRLKSHAPSASDTAAATHR